MTSVATTDTLTASVTARAIPDNLLDELGVEGFAWIPETGRTVVTGGIAARAPITEAARMLAAIKVERHAGAPDELGPLAVGATGWSLDSELVIPARTTIVDGPTAWDVVVNPTLEPDVVEPRSARVPSRFTVAASQSHDEWCEMVRDALALLHDESLEKVVLAREVEVTANAPLDRRAVLERLRRDQPGCVVYSHGPLVGASPELLVARHGPSVLCRPMAGTVPRQATVPDDDRAVHALCTSAKEGTEHELVVDAVVEVLRRFGMHPSVTGPTTQRFTSVTHLVTEVTASNPEPDAGTLAAALHPTPAVGGTPRATASAAIARLEPFRRGLYAGPVGWVDAGGNGEFMVALRGATMEGATAALVAGAGIVAASDPQAEWEETQAKLEPVLRALVRP